MSTGKIKCRELCKITVDRPTLKLKEITPKCRAMCKEAPSERELAACRLRESARQRNCCYFKMSALYVVSQAPPPACAGAPSRREPRITLRRKNGSSKPLLQTNIRTTIKPVGAFFERPRTKENGRFLNRPYEQKIKFHTNR